MVDNTTKRTIAGKFTYENISKTYDVNANGYVFKAYPVNSTSTEPIIYCSLIKTFGIKIGNTERSYLDCNRYNYYNFEFGRA